MSKNPFDSVTFGSSLSLRVDGAIGAMSLSPNGRDAVLAGRRGLFIIDLDEPFTTPRWLHHITSWEVADVQWSPHAGAKPSWCISTSNQKALLWDLSRPSDSAIVNVLHEHTRAITDINFHPSDPEIFATCAIDTFILSWDMRTPRKAVQQWAEWRAGATQVKWNHKNPYEIASSHDHSFYIWDTRKGAFPVLRIEDAHGGKINGINFTDGVSNIITCSNDQSIKFWDLSNFQGTSDAIEGASGGFSPSIIVQTDFPVARARTLPFGSDKSCGVMPLRNGQDSIHIINFDAAMERYTNTKETQLLELDPIYSFKGNSGPMKDFLWRTRHEHYEGFDTKRTWKDYQLVTWSSSNYDLKLWPHDEELYRKVNYNPLVQKAFKQLPLIASPEPDSNSRTSSSSALVTSDSHNYNTYCTEPPLTLTNILYKNKGDLLSSMTMFQIAKKHKHLPTVPSQLNHLAWISGVRMGRNNEQADKMENDDPTPLNLGEEVTFVAHMFPKVRFEKISVSTGELILSLRGPLPAVESSSTVTDVQEEKDDTKAINENTSSEAPNLENPSSSTENPDPTDPKDTLQKEEETEQFPDQENEQKLVFIRLEITFPRSYPYLDDVPLSSNMTKKFQKNNFISFNIEETYDLTSDIKQEMVRNLTDIALFFSNRHQRFCLEPLLRYLMGDKIALDDSLIANTPLNEETEIIQEVGNEDWADDLIDQQPSDTIPTDDDDDFDDQLSDFMPALNDEEMVNSTGSLGKDSGEDPATLALEASVNDEVGNANKFYDSTPVPKGCGAYWARNGKLVCFFIPKDTEEEDSKALQKFSIFRFTDAGFSVNTANGDGDDEDVLDKTDKAGTDTDNESEFSEESDSSTTSSDSFVDEWDDIDEDDLASRFRVPGLFKTSVGLGNRYVSRTRNMNRPNKNSQGGTASNYKSSLPGGDSDFQSSKKRKNKSNKKAKNIVGVFDFSHLIPDKKELAQEYRVLGDSPEKLAKYNSQVALKYGLTEICDTWRLLEMILIKDIEINDIHPVYHSSAVIQKSNSNSTIAKNVEAMNHLLKINEITKKFFGDQTYRFYWGSHPYGYSWLVKEMLNYFERRGNLQMIVMISCILYENTKNVSSNKDIFNIPIHTPYEIKPQPPSMAQIRKFNESFNNKLERNFSFHESLSTELSDPKIENFYDIPRHKNSSVSVIRRETPARYARSIGSDEFIKDESPEHQGSRHNSSLSNAIAPTDSFLRKSFTMSPTVEIEMRSRRGTEYRKPKGIASNVNNRKISRKGSARPPPVVNIEFQNVDSLDLFDDLYTKSLLSLQEDKKIKMYREQYAEMLYCWGLPANRIKILKFNYPNPEKANSKFEEHRCSFGFREKAKTLTGVPYVHSNSTIDSSKENPWNLNKANQLKYCNLCNLLVSKRLVVCTNCEHVLHSSCALEWWSENEEQECPSACGCKCLNYRI
ncbi:hypothetical protein PSN45_002519 [Yamadazyma tenuis]|uniref:RING-type domain-containing protein n=1 Tax=Candida tenuis (strain ATCC 10573 / BCRC 21748 / CBS 615 / JCM 9827 / NBRC 10315 / NRRL Y-1498 / VKM Y-70) TaxID=590646 RepID=G3B069_CANTC|nr:uncharacterized protein CANTEDRAFT_102915 [Yamadazyma tenuis ATCC 10573]EGV65331.1 hypothetical protein CANTEDRAFT_102915 [Yamadazyma tenuis ATCC 10573]WEJ95012.1 hypothetical protein PSN45_002519 [Yamadazyma tenuis]